MRKLLFVLVLASICACKGTNKQKRQNNASEKVTIKMGGSKMITLEDGHQVWTKKIGDGKIKVLLLHGGPAIPHDYLECFEDFLPKEGMEIYYYDQLGCGNSDAPADTSLYNINRYVQEVEQVRKGLGLDNFYIVGHSWGAMLAMEYLAKYQNHVKGAVFSNMTAGMKDYVSYIKQLKQTIFSPWEISVFDSLDRLGKYDSPQYTDLLMNKLYTRVLCQMPVEKWPEPLMRSFKKANHAVYIQMQGVDEFHVTGNFKNWEFWGMLPKISIPVLVLGGMDDEMNPESIKREGALLPYSRTYLCPAGSHMAMYDDQQNYFTSLVTFLKDVDGGTYKPDAKL
jgi:proline iminopeptidase